MVSSFGLSTLGQPRLGHACGEAASFGMAHGNAGQVFLDREAWLEHQEFAQKLLGFLGVPQGWCTTTSMRTVGACTRFKRQDWVSHAKAWWLRWSNAAACPARQQW